MPLFACGDVVRLFGAPARPLLETGDGSAEQKIFDAGTADGVADRANTLANSNEPCILTPSPSDRMVAVGLGVDVQIWSGESSSCCVIGACRLQKSVSKLAWHWRETALLVIHNDGSITMVRVAAENNAFIDDRVPRWVDCGGNTVAPSYPKKLRLVVGTPISLVFKSVKLQLTSVATSCGLLIFGGNDGCMWSTGWTNMSDELQPIFRGQCAEEDDDAARSAVVEVVLIETFVEMAKRTCVARLTAAGGVTVVRMEWATNSGATICVCRRGSTAISACSRSHRLAVGDQSGAVHFFHIHSVGQKTLSQHQQPTGGLVATRLFIVNSPRPTTGRVLSVTWHPDGTALAVCRSDSSLEVVAPTGQICFAYAPSVESAGETGCLQAGCAWTHGGYGLMFRCGKDIFCMQRFMRLAQEVGISLDNSGSATEWILGASDVLTSNPTARQNSDPCWQRLVPGQRYCAANAPLRYIAVSPNQDRVAVAGHRGFSICSVTAHRWHIFGDVTQEQNICSEGLFWWDENLLINVHNEEYAVEQVPEASSPSDGAQQLQFWFCGRSGITGCQHQLSVERGWAVKAMQRLDSDLLFVLLETTRHSVGRCRYKYLLLRVFWNGAVSSSSLVVTNESSASVVLPHAVRCSAVVEQNGSMYLVGLLWSGEVTCSQLNDQNGNGWAMLPGPYDRLDYLAFGPDPCVLPPTIWLHDGLQVCAVQVVASSAGGAGPALSSHLCASWPSKAHPLGASKRIGALLGLSHETDDFTRNPKGVRHSMIRLPLMHLVVNDMLGQEKMWQNSSRELALLVRAFGSGAQLGERLLWHALQRVHANQNNPADASHIVLHRVLQLLRRSGVYLDTIVNCARRCEQAWWPFLFPLAGSPVHLFESCVAADKLEKAGALLPIIAFIADVKTLSKSGMGETTTQLRLLRASELQELASGVSDGMSCARRLIDSAATVQKDELVAQVEQFLQRLELVAQEIHRAQLE